MLQPQEGSMALPQYRHTVACLHCATDFLLVARKEPCFCQQGGALFPRLMKQRLKKHVYAEVIGLCRGMKQFPPCKFSGIPLTHASESKRARTCNVVEDQEENEKTRWRPST